MLTRRIPVKAARKAWTSTLVDSDVYEWASRYSWYLINGYVYRYQGSGRKQKRQWFLLHREIVGGEQVDHQNRDTLDNRRVNLRPCTVTQNRRNRIGNRLRVGKRPSRYKGVFPQSSQNTWMAKIGVDGRQVYLGSFTTEEDAARAYNAAAQRLFGEFARLNEIGE